MSFSQALPSRMPKVCNTLQPPLAHPRRRQRLRAVVWLRLQLLPVPLSVPLLLPVPLVPLPRRLCILSKCTMLSSQYMSTRTDNPSTINST